MEASQALNPTQTQQRDETSIGSDVNVNLNTNVIAMNVNTGTNNDRDEDKDTDGDGESLTTATPPPTPPLAPQKLRRRRPLLFDRLRTRRRQMLQQHYADNNKNGGNNDSNNNNAVQRRQQPHSLVEDYYRVDTVISTPSVRAAHAPNSLQQQQEATELSLSDKSALQQQHQKGKRVKVILPGVPRYEEDWARDSHDFFNLVVLVPVTVLNIMNWNWDVLFAKLSRATTLEAALSAVQKAWTGDWFDLFFAVTAGYFLIDLLWILTVPVCVKSPAVILQHHIAVLIYILIPYHHTAVRYCMGACMTVEINTWFLIARRVFNKQGFPPWTVFNSSWLSIRVKVISICFYLTWIFIRCLLYPALLIPFYRHWRDLSIKKGTWINILLPSVPLHAAFCLLNLKWSYELLMSKLRYFRRYRLYQQQQQQRRLGNANGAGAGGQHRRYPSFSDPSISSGL